MVSDPGGQQRPSKPADAPRSLDWENWSVAAEASSQRTIQYTPSVPGALPSTDPAAHPGPGDCLAPGQFIADFQVLRVLGRGACGVVYLARQVSLDRVVALKVTADEGSEARTMASLEHRQIVQVFSETVEPSRRLRLLCMQYVPGVALDAVIHGLAQRGGPPRTGKDLLEILDEASVPVSHGHYQLEDRSFLASCGYAEAVCWIGARLAEALAYAHGRGVIHRDVKPANVLLGPHGRPKLADFSLSLRSEPGDSQVESIGGTLAYMAPEHLDAFNPDDPTPPEAVDQRSDVYSLGVVLYEMLTLRLPFVARPATESRTELLRALAAERRQPVANLQIDGVQDALVRIVRRCLAPDPTERFQSAGDLATALDGCRKLLEVRKQLPATGRLTRAFAARPVLWVTLLAAGPNVLGTLVFTTYRGLRVFGSGYYAPDKYGYYITFASVVLVSAYLASAVIWTWMLWPLLRVRWFGRQATEDIVAARQRIAALPSWLASLTCAAWAFGLGSLLIGPPLLTKAMPPPVLFESVASLVLSWLIAMTYSYLGVQYLCLVVLYPQLWPDPANLEEITSAELRGTRPWLRGFEVLAGLVPLCGAALLVGIGPEGFGRTAALLFRVVAIDLIALGIIGVYTSIYVTNLLVKALEILTGVAKGPK